MNKLLLHLIRKLTDVDVEKLQDDNESLLIRNQQLSFEVKDVNKEAAYRQPLFLVGKRKTGFRQYGTDSRERNATACQGIHIAANGYSLAGNTSAAYPDGYA